MEGQEQSIRSDRSPQIVVALAVTREGLPVRIWVFPGNTSDVETVKRVREDLRGWKLGRALFVADSGMNSSTNRDELARACGNIVPTIARQIITAITFLFFFVVFSSS